ncbi:hypothetical protein JAAARDRAFT_116363 [Jaapia argillacea MUCL 33604]|uniref:Uncharacterized protein n=1 Tax=Jaapia argillacea MUCL 33604 TaxID=933084 RepID=A0A067QLU9_9AGAM|nr:hypothetical protein JAAARDRAFT_116363 [Jaapia argillacea MUCL 33604]
MTLEDVQLETAKEALTLLERLQHLLTEGLADEHSHSQGGKSTTDDETSSLGARDLSQIRTLFSIVFKWGVDALLSKVAPVWSTKPSTRVPKIIDLTATPQDYGSLSAMATQVMALLFPSGISGALSQTYISVTLLNHHTSELLLVCLTLGWLPRALSSEVTPTLDGIRPLTMRILNTLPPDEVISTLGAVLSTKPTPPPHVRKTCSLFLGRQLMRPEGVKGLFSALFSAEVLSESDAPLEKLEHASRVLCAPPAGVKPEDYFQQIVPRIIDVLSPRNGSSPSSYIRAAAFCLSRMISPSRDFPYFVLVSQLSFQILHGPFLDTPAEGLQSDPDDSQPRLTPADALSTLVVLITNTDPSPTLISSILGPIVPSLYALLDHLEGRKTSDPEVKESIRGLLTTWGRVVSNAEIVDGFWSIILGEGGHWSVDVAGGVQRVASIEQPSNLALFTPEDIQRAEDDGELDIDANIFNLYPDPGRFTRLLSLLDRGEAASEIFTRLLDRYRELKTAKDKDPMQTLLYLQLILQMQSHLSSGISSNILGKPEQALPFVKHALETAVLTTAAPQATNRQRVGLRMEDLRIVAEMDDQADDSDDEETGSGAPLQDDEMTVTALNLLLAILESSPSLSARSAPILNEIFSLLESVTHSESETIRPLAREARMVMTVRLASTSTAQDSRRTSGTSEEEDARGTYQKALKLLQDPILPVRAHGLLLLRQLVSRPSPNQPAAVTSTTNSALLPAILDIFLQSAQDDDSYIFLNAVQGLSAMVEGFGKDVLRGLIDVYAKGSGDGPTNPLSQSELDTRLRVGEALEQVIRRCGDALPDYGGILVPALFQVFRARSLPTTLQTSALSLLGQCAKTSVLALLPFASDLCSGVIDLLQLENVPMAPPAKSADEESGSSGPSSMDAQPTSTYSKFPPFRRAALHFFTLFLRASLVQRAKVTLGYVAASDQDDVVRVMAREANEDLGDLERLIVGL